MERIILQIGAWELLNRPGTPLTVILDEAVELARRFGAEGGHSYVNAVLDRAARQWRAQEAANARGRG
jgi:N utilization substance protein B